MCGIVGGRSLRGGFDPRVLQAMTDAIAARGPDGEGHFIHHAVGLGHRRLAILDLAGGAQPMLSPDGRYALSFNGEIFNFRSLRQELETLGHRFIGSGDTEVLLHAAMQWGEDVPQRLEGQFAFALYDQQQDQLLLTRDHFGIKPLYVYQSQDALLFASELKGIVAAGVGLTIDPVAIDLFLTYGYIPSPQSIYREVRKLPAGACLLVDASGQTRQWQHFRLGREALTGVEPFSCREDLDEELRRAVASQLVSDVPLGLFLSGGADSTSIARVLEGVAGVTSAFFMATREADPSEALAQGVATELGLPLVQGISSPVDQEASVARLMAIFDEPFASDSVFPTLDLCRLARDRVKVALSGDGGDEFQGGYNRFLGFLNQPQNPLARLAGGVARVLPIEGSSVRRVASWGMPDGERYARQLMRSSAQQRHGFYAAKMQQQLPHPDDGDYLTALWPDGDWTPGQRLGLVDGQSFLPEHGLTKVDRISMSVGLEVRVPFLDRRFALRCLASGDEMRFGRQGRKVVQGKVWLRQLLEQRLGGGVAFARKRGFSSPLKQWVNAPTLRSLADRMEASGAMAAWFDTRRLAKAARKAAQSTSARQFWFAMVILEQFCSGR